MGLHVVPRREGPSASRPSTSRARCQAGIKAIGFHALRHTFGTRLSEARERLEVIAELMGHAKIEMTKVYIHPSLQSKRQAVAKALITYWSQEAQRREREKAD